MGVVKMLKTAVGAGADDVAELERQIEDTRGAGLRGHAELERLEASRLTADTYDDAMLVNEQIARVKWATDHAAAQLSDLESRLSVSRAARNRKLLQKH